MKKTRLLLAALALALTTAACSADPVGPRQEDDCPMMGSGVGC